MYFVYILKCADDSLYTGITSDIIKRIRVHYYKLPAAAKYTKSHQVTGLMALWSCETKNSALKFEYRIKTLSKDDKLILCRHKKEIKDYFPELSEIKYNPVKNISFEDCIKKASQQ